MFEAIGWGTYIFYMAFNVIAFLIGKQYNSGKKVGDLSNSIYFSLLLLCGDQGPKSRRN